MSSANNRENYNEALIEEYRATGGAVTERFATRPLPLLLLTTIGAKSGRKHTTPLVYTTDGDRLVVIASKGGAPTNPDWYRNLLAHPEATVEVGREAFQVRATPVEGAERERLYDHQAALMPVFARYREKTTRQIPVVILERQG